MAQLMQRHRTANGVNMFMGANFRGHDPRSDKYRLSLRLDPTGADLSQTRNLGQAWFNNGADYRIPITDQGQLGACTAFTVKEHMECDAKLNGNDIAPVSAGWIYEMERKQEQGANWAQDWGAFTNDGFDIVIAGGAPKESLAPYTQSASTEYDNATVEADRPNQKTILIYYPIPPRDPNVLQLMWKALDSFMFICVETQWPEGWFNPNTVGAVSTDYSDIAGGHSIKLDGWIADKSMPGGLGTFLLPNHWTPQWNTQCRNYGNNARAGDFLMPSKIFTDKNSPVMAIYAVTRVVLDPNPPVDTEKHVQAADDAVAQLQSNLTQHPRSTNAKQQLKGGQFVQTAVQHVA